MSANGSGESRPSREIAYRLFAAEFDDASFSYSESDEERAPNYVVTPTGARVNRLFAVGVLTEVEAVNDDVLRGRIVDPTGAFVSYAGQYQPDEMAFLDRASPPAFVALSGKARTFQPEDSDRVFTSVRPESMSRVDADTRDRWTVSTAEATLARVGVMAAARQSGLTGSDLHDALVDAGVDEALATGIPLALDHYGTTPGYLAALRRLALDALEVVANDRDSVRALDIEPGDVGKNVDLAALAADLDLSAPVTPESDESGERADVAEAASEEVEAESVSATTDPVGDTTEPESTSTAEADEQATTPAEAPAADTSDATLGETSSEPDDDGPVTDPVTAETPSAAESEAEPATPDTGADGDNAPSEPTPASTAAEPSEPASESTSTATTNEPEPEPAATAEDELGDFDAGGSMAEDESTPHAAESAEAAEDELGDFDAGGSPSASEADADAVDATEATTDADGMYELDAEERAEVEAEFGTEFSTGSEVAPAGEADIDVPSMDELESELGAAEKPATPAADAAEDAGTAASTDSTDPVDTEPSAEEPEPAGAVDDAEDTDGDADADVDLETVAVEAMDALDDGDGASRDAVVEHVVAEYGADPEAVEDAIQSALMSGQCYEPTEDSLKAI